MIPNGSGPNTTRGCVSGLTSLDGTSPCDFEMEAPQTDMDAPIVSARCTSSSGCGLALGGLDWSYRAKSEPTDHVESVRRYHVAPRRDTRHRRRVSSPLSGRNCQASRPIVQVTFENVQSLWVELAGGTGRGRTCGLAHG